MSIDRYYIDFAGCPQIDNNDDDSDWVKFTDHKKDVEDWKAAAEVEAEQHDKCLKEIEGLKQWIREIVASEDLLLDLGWSQTMNERGIKLLKEMR